MKKLLFILSIFLISGTWSFSQVTQQQIDAFKGTTTGTNSYSVTINSITATAPYDGQKIWVKFGAANSGASTLKVNSFSALAITLNGAALASGDIVINQYVGLVYYLAGTSWQIQKPGLPAPTITAGASISVTTGSNSYTIANTAPNQTVTLTGAGTTTVSGTYPTYTVTGGGTPSWALNGNTEGSEKWIGTNDNFAFPIRTNSVVVATFNSTGELGVGVVATAGIRTHFKGSGADASTSTLLLENSAGTDLLWVKNDGNIIAGDPADNNLSIGINNGFGGTAADESVYIGFGCGTSITDGYRNVLIGKNVFANLTTGDNNIGVGSSGVGSGVSTGSNNVLIGQIASGNTGNSVCVGHLAGNSSSGTENTYVGYGAGFLKGAGNYNAFFGEAAGGGAASAGSTNTFIGGEAGYLNTGSGNVYLGYSAGWRQGAVSNKFILNNALRANASLELTTSLQVGTFGTDSSNQDLKVNAELLLTSGISTSAGDAATIEAQTGRFRKDATGSAFTLTNANITANSIIILTPVTVGLTGGKYLTVQAGTGSAVITFEDTATGIATPPSANMDVNFVIINNL